MVEPTSQQLLARYRAGDSRAEVEIFDRYVRRLIELARQRISPQLARRIDPDDVVQSAYRSFFVHAWDGDFVLQRAGDLWRLLAGITLNKLHGQIERHTAQRRTVAREQEAVGGGDRNLAAAEPSPAEAAGLAEQLQRIMQQLNAVERQVLEMRLQGSTIAEIADSIDRSQRTVRRLLDKLRRQMEQRLLGGAQTGAAR